ncbi:ankyrin repeat domain-containing protein [Legionella bononiensis]|uniref:Ankyrin repeat domain-containing protein n=1 Tax=Legionella bononiensis TaxID=2793102 RepID=A0ABS1WD85_9GAMM|nr:ankyrin repeat domain-containing protein [Legionella bononiensis]MBL7481202.1 ankyrin repeat domain-containing protein [Legionella bononiensis]MBL7527308.1 ankyrin repeat domain-containing protein [Legionella bononiensis]MBL7562277.1 ankyrin repeat domain-containing protein [Legionella bononiensis]
MSYSKHEQSTQAQNINTVPDEQFITALLNNDLLTIKRLLGEGVLPDDLELVDTNGRKLTPLQFAVEIQQSDLVTLLLKSGSDPNRVLEQNDSSPLNVALKSRDVLIINALLQFNANPDRPSGHSSSGSPEFPLDLAVESGDVHLIRILLNAGASPNNGTFPLHTAIAKGQLEITKALLEYGALPDSRCLQMLTNLNEIGSFPKESSDEKKQILSLNFRIAIALMCASIDKSRVDILTMSRSLIDNNSDNWRDKFRDIISYLEHYNTMACPPIIKVLCINLLRTLTLREVNDANYPKILEQYILDNQPDLEHSQEKPFDTAEHIMRDYFKEEFDEEDHYIFRDYELQIVIDAVNSYINKKATEPEYTTIFNVEFSRMEKLDAVVALLDVLDGKPVDKKLMQIFKNEPLFESFNHENELSDSVEQPSENQRFQNPNTVSVRSESSGVDSYRELALIIRSKHFVEPMMPFKIQYYPNLFAILAALDKKEDFKEIQHIANIGINKNRELKELYPEKALDCVNNRLVMFEAIRNANSVEDALIAIKKAFPDGTNTPISST